VGITLVLLSAAGFGSGALLVQPLYAAGMTTMAVLFWRFATAALFSWLFLALSARRRGSLRALSGRRMAVLMTLGLLYVGNSFAFIASLQVVPISLASIIAYLYPAIVAVMATRFARRLEGRRAWLALLISLVGVALTVGGIRAGEAPPLWGLALAFANPVIYATWIVLQARLAGERPVRRADEVPPERALEAEAMVLPPGDAETIAPAPDPAPAAALMTSGTALAYALLTLVLGGSLSPADVPTGVWPPLLGFGLVATALAIQTFYAGVRRIGGARASLISTVEPVYTVALAVVLFGEMLTPIQLLGGGLVIGAVILAESGAPDTLSSRRTRLDRGPSTADDEPSTPTDGRRAPAPDRQD
jgi:drug/metabolite transporter (DMT)-like permease